MKCGIVGLPNVGKSTLFNALIGEIKAQAANYPFCTIEPNSGIVSVPDARLEVLARMCDSKEIVPARLEFVDIAGLVKGASRGEGLGNKVLANIREVDAVIHVVRCFEDKNIARAGGNGGADDPPDPRGDVDVVNAELMLADMESLQRRLPLLEKKAKSGDRDAGAEAGVMARVLDGLERGLPAVGLALDEAEKKMLGGFSLLTAKPTLMVANVDEASAAGGNAYSGRLDGAIVVSARIEEEIAALPLGEREGFLSGLGLGETGLSKIIRGAYGRLNLITFFTAGAKETRAWTVRKGTRAPSAAGVIHTDFECGFIRAEAVSYADFVASGGAHGAREKGLLRSEGRDYEVADGDIMHFLFNR
ncbi:MAG: redox-regulated ATPase YchF [Rickettsiales bacterium]|jgi:GTP-binding protein YchF|nr:redox-regulated ATPase YchF [Rickettsiales bacterium]